ncbi:MULTISPECIES: YncE family protein [unclassified Saccharothrix]|uniref:YncE family protein n=1 Tax=unclassified Saccharothrix TaxID=2593673 RepID=UPI00307D293E
MRRLAAAVLTGTALLSGCATGDGSGDPLQVAATLEPATPAESPQVTATPEGTVLPMRAASAVAVLPGYVAVALSDPPSVALHPLDNLAAPRVVPLPGVAERLVVAGDAVEAPVPGGGVVVTVRTDGTTSSRPVDGGPVDVALVDGKAVVARRDAKVLDVAGRAVTGVSSPDRLVAVGDHAVVLDRPRSAVFDVDLGAEPKLGAGLRAGEGATTAVADRFGRVLVVDTRGGELMAFSVRPLIMRQRFPLPGAPYGMAYDERRDLLWVTLTERNEVVAFDVAGGEPVEKHRYATVRQPDSVAVDPGSGRVFVASGDGQGMQVIGS